MNRPLGLAAIKVVEVNEAENLKMSVWQMWHISLAGKNVSDVASLSIGLDTLGGADGTGKVQIDDLRLYPLHREQIPSTAPGTVG